MRQKLKTIFINLLIIAIPIIFIGTIVHIFDVLPGLKPRDSRLWGKCLMRGWGSLRRVPSLLVFVDL